MAEAIKKKKMSLGTKSLIGVAAGLIVGAILDSSQPELFVMTF